MKPFKELSRLGRLRRLRKLARAALKEYGMETANLTFTHYGGNVIFRVDLQEPVLTNIPLSTYVDPYVPGKYNLRILSTSHYEGITSELTWLTALRQQGGFPVPEPVLTLDGKPLTKIATPGVPRERHVTLMRWLDGRRRSTGSLRPKHLHAWGQLVAKLHNFASIWVPPDGFTRPDWDWDGQLGEGVLPYPTNELIAAMPERLREPFQIVSNQIHEVMDALGKGREAYGLIHGDMYLENVLFKSGLPCLIDFEDCGFGYWMWDIGVVFSQWSWDEQHEWMRDSFIDGYLKERTLPDEQLKHLDLFVAAQQATMVLWSTAFIRSDPAMMEEYEAWRMKEGAKLLGYFRRI